jgi:RNA polymerase sigma factor (sigma-70 family)
VVRPEDMAELVLRVARDRDRQAFARLFDHFAPRLNGYLQRLGADSGTAEEVTQEVMTTLWRKAEQFDPSRSSLATWLYRIARNRRIDGLRRDRSDNLDPNDPSLMPAAAADPLAAVDLGRREERLKLVLEGLPEEQLVLVRLAFYDGLSHSDIAARTGLPLGTVKSRLRLAFTRLRRSLEAAGIIDAG